MINIPLPKIKERILEETDLSEDALDEKISAKLEQLSGLISEQGAAHIIANELGVKLVEQSGRLQIKNIVEGLRDVEVVGKAAQVYEINEFESNGREGKVGSFLLGDDTGVIRVTLWNDQADLMEDLEQGDVVKITGGYVKKNRNRLELHINERADLHIDPDDVTVDFEVKQRPDSSRKSVADLEEDDDHVEVMATVVQVFEPRFFEVYKDSGKRVQEDDPDEETEHAYVMNAFLDDGSDNVRCVFWRRQTQNLLDMDDEAIQTFRDDPLQFDEIKTDLLGKIVKVEGRVQYNDRFERLELVARRVDLNPDPEEEMKQLDEAAQQAAKEAEPVAVDEAPSAEDEPATTASDDTDQEPAEPDADADDDDATKKASVSDEAMAEGMVEEEDFDDDDIPSLDEL
jgi:hypothetical protein